MFLWDFAYWSLQAEKDQSSGEPPSGTGRRLCVNVLGMKEASSSRSGLSVPFSSILVVVVEESARVEGRPLVVSPPFIWVGIDTSDVVTLPGMSMVNELNSSVSWESGERKVRTVMYYMEIWSGFRMLDVVTSKARGWFLPCRETSDSLNAECPLSHCMFKPLSFGRYQRSLLAARYLGSWYL